MPTEQIKLRYQCPFCMEMIDIARAYVGEVVDCPNCRHPFLPKVPEATVQQTSGDEPAPFEVSRPANDEKVLKEMHPAMIRRHPLQFVGLCLLAIVLVYTSFASISSGFTAGLLGSLFGLILIGIYMLSWWIEVISTELRISNKRTTLRTGIIAKTTTEVQHDDIRNIQVHQNMIERVLGVGALAISSSGQDDMELQVKGIVHPGEVADMVRRMQ